MTGEPAPESPTIWRLPPLPNELDAELSALIPGGYTLSLVMRSPIANRRKTQAALAKKLSELISDPATFPSDQPMHLYGNTITPYLNHHGQSGYKKISAAFMHQTASADILSNTRYILEDRISVKAKKCAHLTGPLWLALLNDYYLTDLHTYKYALSFLTTTHSFGKILLIGRDGRVEVLV